MRLAKIEADGVTRRFNSPQARDNLFVSADAGRELALPGSTWHARPSCVGSSRLTFDRTVDRAGWSAATRAWTLNPPRWLAFGYVEPRNIYRAYRPFSSPVSQRDVVEMYFPGCAAREFAWTN